MNAVTDPAKRAELWARARASFARLVAAIYALTALTPKLQRYISGWTAQLESIVRKLLFAEAAHLQVAIPRAAATTRRANAKAAAPASSAAASFSFAIPRQPQTRRARVSTGAERDHIKRIAFRLKALRRALADPLPFAVRLARILARRASATINARFAVAPARPHHTDRFDPRLIIEAFAEALTAKHAYADTT